MLLCEPGSAQPGFSRDRRYIDSGSGALQDGRGEKNTLKRGNTLAVSDIDRHLGRKIEAARQKLGLSHETLATLAEIDPDKIRAMETGALRVSSFALARIARHVGEPLSWFFDGLPGQDVFDKKTEKNRSV